MSNSPSQDDDRTVIIGSSSSAPPQPAPSPAAPPPASAAPFPASSPSPARAAPSSAASSAGDSGNAVPLGTYLGEFELISVLGEGGFGIVYSAWDHSLERKVALKEYMPSALAARTGATQVQVKSERHRETFEAGRKSFVNEAKLLAQFDHPALVKVYRFWEANGTAYMVMPLYEGITLKDWLRQQTTPPDEGWLMDMLAPLTEALAVIHTERCYHRDIAPDNIILLHSTGRPLLLDFGAARRVIGDMTQALTVILKPGYAPVEQYAEAPHMKQGGWTDIYALAASIHFALLGRTPPPSVSRMMSDTYQPLTGVLNGRYSERFLAAIDRALLVKPEERTQSIGELRNDLGLGPSMASSSGPASTFGQSTFGQSTFGQSTFGQSTYEASTFGDSRLHDGPTQVAGRNAAPAPAPRSKTPLIAALAAVVVVGGGAAAWLATRSSEPAPGPAQVAQAPAPVQTAPAPAPVTAAPAPAPAPAAASAQRFDAQAEYDRVIAGQNGGFQITAAPTKPQYKLGEKLGFSITSSRDGYVQVLMRDPDGMLVHIFPNTEASNNRIRAGQTLQLPGAKWPIEASEPIGLERFLVVVSEQPRDYSVLSTERIFYGMLQLPTGARADGLIQNWTRPTPMLLGTAPASCQGPECDAYGAAAFSVNVTR